MPAVAIGSLGGEPKALGTPEPPTLGDPLVPGTGGLNGTSRMGAGGTPGLRRKTFGTGLSFASLGKRPKIDKRSDHDGDRAEELKRFGSPGKVAVMDLLVKALSKDGELVREGVPTDVPESERERVVGDRLLSVGFYPNVATHMLVGDGVLGHGEYEQILAELKVLQQRRLFTALV